jgi:DNA-binding winged helix-turn-helix (wHTH) protein/tetratricopeptide (TPR) repeat protein
MSQSDAILHGDFYVGDCLVRSSRGEIVRAESVIRAEPRVFDVLRCLAEHAGEVVSKDEIYRVVWADASLSDHVLTHAIWQLRQALGDREAIQTIPKRGYRLAVPVRPVETVRPAPAQSGGTSVSRLRRRATLVVLASVTVAVAVGSAIGFAGRYRPIRGASPAALEPTPQLSPRQHPSGTSNAAAYEAFVRGRKLLARGLYAKSAECFEEAVSKDPQYALAYANLAEAYGMMNFAHGFRDPRWVQKRSAAGQRAIQLDPTMPEVHIFLGDRNFFGEWDWAAGEAEFWRAVERDPASPDARTHLALALGSLGRFDEAIEEMKRSRALDPLSPEITLRLASMLRDAGQLEPALEQARRAVELNPSGAAPRQLTALILEDMGRGPEAAVRYREAARLEGHAGPDPDDVERALAAGGLPRYWALHLEHLTAQAKTSHVPVVEIARIYARLGQFDRALQLLETGYQQHEFGMVSINSSADWRPLRSDARFRALLRRMHFPEVE